MFFDSCVSFSFYNVYIFERSGHAVVFPNTFQKDCFLHVRLDYFVLDLSSLSEIINAYLANPLILEQIFSMFQSNLYWDYLSSNPEHQRLRLIVSIQSLEYIRNPEHIQGIPVNRNIYIWEHLYISVPCIHRVSR